MIIEAPCKEDLQNVVGPARYSIWENLCAKIEAHYRLDRVWHSGSKKWVYELKFRRGQKTICSFLFKEETLGFMVIFGKPEQMRFEGQREFSRVVAEVYDTAKAYHDGKWLLFEAREELSADFMKLLQIKRKPDML